MSINEAILKSTNFFLPLFVIFTVLPVKLNYSSIVIIILCVIGLINFVVNRKSIVFSKPLIFLICIPLGIYILGLINTSNLDYGLSFLVKNLSFLIFPLIFFSLSKYIDQEKVLKSFLMGLALNNIYLIYLFFYYFNFGAKFYMIVSIDMYHSTYMGMNNLIAFWVCVFFFKKGSKKEHLLLALFFLVSGVLTSARIIFLLAIVSLVVSFVMILNSKIQKIGAILLTFIIGCIVLVTVPSVKQKFSQFIEISEIGFDKNNYQSISSRFGKIEASAEVMKKNLWFGTGTGDIIDELVKEYREMKFVMGYKYRYNPHNQYLDNIVRNGLIGGGISLIIIYILPMIVAFKTKDFLMLAFILIISSVSLTESILDVHKGITFYVFFVTLLLHKHFHKNPNLSN
jgi:hypothetical protein